MERKDKLLELLKENGSLYFERDTSMIILRIEDNKIRLTRKMYELDENKMMISIDTDTYITENVLEEFCNDETLFKQVSELYKQKNIKENDMTNEYHKMIMTLDSMDLSEEDKDAIKDVIDIVLRNEYYNFNKRTALTINDPISKKIGFKLISLQFDSPLKYSDDYESIINEIVKIKHKNNILFYNNIYEANVEHKQNTFVK